MQPYYAYEQHDSGAALSCTMYLPNNAAVRVIKVSHNAPLAKDESRKVRDEIRLWLIAEWPRCWHGIGRHLYR